ncbi:type IV secretion system protein [Phenylobacterium sp.]|jgi:type IV secretion system protein VirB6|uniref:type IV secretion system protein n=1 Tax=Phenylobacterium sp. TaxID=1871053 RepID=UPI002F9245E5
MIAQFGVFGPAYAFVDARLDLFLGESLPRVAAEAAGPTRAALVLYVLLYGVAILRGAIAEPILDFAVRSVKLAIVHQLATTSAYGDWVTVPLFHLLPDALAQAVSGTRGSDAGAAFDDFLARAGYLGQKAAAAATAFDWLPLVVSAIVLAVGALAAALGFGVVLLAKTALALLVALGPIFVACALFEATRRFFFGWLAQAVNYLVLFALILAVFQLVLALVADRWADLDGQDPVLAGLLFTALSLLAAIFFLQTPAIAAGVAGGASLGLADFGAAAGLRGHTAVHTRPAGAGGRPQTRREGGTVRPIGAPA